MSTVGVNEGRTQLPVFRDAGSLVRYLSPGVLSDDMDAEAELERLHALIQTKQGQATLLARIRSQHPDVPESQVYDHVLRNIEQLRKKESFLMKIVKMPLKAIQSIGGVIRRNPVTSALVGLAGLIALLYFLPAPPGVGRFRDSMIESTRNMLTRVGVSLPQAQTDAIAAVPVTGGAASPQVIERGREILQSPSNTQQQIDRLRDLLPQ